MKTKIVRKQGTAREELEKVIDENGKHINIPCPYHSQDQECSVCDGTGMLYTHTEVDSKQLIQSILDAGFVRLEDVEVDKMKVDEILSRFYLTGAFDREYREDKNSVVARVITEAKGIIKMREGKNEV